MKAKLQQYKKGAQRLVFLFYRAGYRCFMLRYICLYLYIISDSYTLYLRFLSNF